VIAPADGTSATPSRDDAARRLVWKHALDRIAAAMLILLLTPVLIAVAVAVKLSSGGPVLVRDRRLDREGASFEMLGFRSQQFLERWSLDQLPQLFNVLKGEMSFVGPRPERPEFVELFGENLRRYDQPRSVKPGIAGWAQLRGLEGPAPLAERVRWDDFYVENWSPWLDLKILLLTLRAVWRGTPAG
jgi:lipopolysaccharide/colanic/teichoic acid biosynthesis glycosyltransferase